MTLVTVSSARLASLFCRTYFAGVLSGRNIKTPRAEHNLKTEALPYQTLILLKRIALANLIAGVSWAYVLNYIFGASNEKVSLYFSGIVVRCFRMVSRSI